MSKYINLDDPDVTYSHNLGQHEVYIVGTEAERIDIVRCGECKHRDPEDKKCNCGSLERAGCIFPVDDSYFCADGERRADDERIHSADI